MTKLYRSNGRFYKIDGGEWVFWCINHWEYSEDANDPNSYWHKGWKADLKLIGNNFRLK